MFAWIIWVLWEIRIDISTGIKYRYNGTTRIVDGTGTPSSTGFPVVWVEIWEVREDLKTWAKYRFGWRSWALITTTNDTNRDWKPDVAGTVEDNSISTAKIQDEAVNLSKTKIVTTEVPVLLWTTIWTITVAAWSVILGIYPAWNQDQLISAVYIEETTLTIRLDAAATSDNVFNVVTSI